MYPPPHTHIPPPVFHKYYHSPTLSNGSVEAFHQLRERGGLLRGNGTEVGGGIGLSSLPDSFIQCTRERPVLCLLLMLGTLWVGYTLYQFKRRYVQGGALAGTLKRYPTPIGTVAVQENVGMYVKGMSFGV